MTPFHNMALMCPATSSDDVDIYVSVFEGALDEILQRVKAAVAKAPAGGWIYGDIGSRVLDDERATRSTVDAVAAGHPVMLTAWTGHGTLFNTAALRRLQVRDDEPDPPGGWFGRADGKLTGLAHEYANYMLQQRLSMIPDRAAQVGVALGHQ